MIFKLSKRAAKSGDLKDRKIWMSATICLIWDTISRVTKNTVCGTRSGVVRNGAVRTPLTEDKRFFGEKRNPTWISKCVLERA